MDIGAISFIAFIVAMGLLVYWKRDKVEIHGPVVMARTKKFKKDIESFALKYRGFWKIYFSIGVIVAILAGLLGTGYMVFETYNIVSGSSVPTLGLVIPYPSSEVSIRPGLVTLPPWIWLIAIIILLIPHELSHGLALAMNKLKIKSLGLISFFIIPGAFVEPDEKQLKKAKLWNKLQVYCAGSFSNIVTAILLIFVFHGFIASFYSPAGAYYFIETRGFELEKSDILELNNLSSEWIEVVSKNGTFLTNEATLNATLNKTYILATKDLPSLRGGMPRGGAILSIDGVKTIGPKEIDSELSKRLPGETILVETSSGAYNITLADRNGTGYIGINIDKGSWIFGALNPTNRQYYEVKEGRSEQTAKSLGLLLSLTIAICLGVAIFNMFPMKPLDGGHVIDAIFGQKAAKYSSIAIFIMVLLSLGAALLINFGIMIF
jgi:membrane-associated protease RseP (regulator of RpoE activity)